MLTKIVKLTGTSPLLMHATTSIDPTHKLSRAMKAITSKHASKKTEDDLIELKRLEFEAGLYFDDEIGPYLPGELLQACIRDGGKANRLGSEVTRSVLVVDDRVCLIYAGPRTKKGLWEKGFSDTRSVKIGQNRVLRTRPIFSEWAVEFQVQLDVEHLDPGLFDECVANAGQRVGLGDYRPRFGRFTAEIRE